MALTEKQKWQAIGEIQPMAKRLMAVERMVRDISRALGLEAQDNAALAQLKDGMWSGRPAFVIGGGPSLRGFDYGKLAGHLCIAVNRAQERLDAAVVFSVDHRWLRWTLDGALVREDGVPARDILRGRRGYKVMRHNDGELTPPEFIDIPMHPTARWSRSIRDGVSCYGNSGFAAVNLAHMLGARTIYLLGFDQRGEEDRQAWEHTGYPVVEGTHRYALNVDAFEQVAAPHLRDTGTEVVNLSPESAITCFPRRDRDDFLEADTPVVVSFYTANHDYRERAETLRRSLVRWGIRHHIQELPDRGKWELNCAQKPVAILAAMEAHPGRPVVWLDADSEVVRFPHLFCGGRLSADIAHGVRKRPGASDEVLSGTLWIAPTFKAKEIVTTWATACRREPEKWDQKSLADVLARFREAKIEALPTEYCWFDLVRHQTHELPIIEHRQASRQNCEARQ